MRRMSWVVVLMWGAAAAAQVRTDGSVGAKQTLVGPNFSIGAGLGRQVGGNLYHSFAEFNVGANESARFSGPGSVKNVLARVTGGTASMIDGTLGCDIPKANLFLINPAGVVFGPGAALDVRGSFVVTSADYVRMGKDGRFAATPGKGEVLSTASPVAFGFLGKGSGDVTLIGSRLAVGTGRAMTVAANGNIGLGGAVLSAPAGRVNLVAAGSAGEVGVRVDRLDSGIDSTLTGYGDVLAVSSSGIDTSGTSGGPVVVRARNMGFDGSAIAADTTGSGAVGGGTVDVRLMGQLSFANGSGVSVNALAGAPGGRLVVHADGVSLTGGSKLVAVNGGSGSGGSIAVEAREISLSGADTGVATVPAPGATGPGGDVSLRADRLSLRDGAQAAVSTFGDAAGGALVVHAGELLLRGVRGTGGTTGLFAGSSAGANGTGGSVFVRATGIRIDRGAALGGATTGAGLGPDVRVIADTLNLEDAGSAISARTFGTGRGGTIRMDVGSLTIANGAAIDATTVTNGPGGDVNVNAREVLIRGTGVASAQTGIFAGAIFGASGTGGDVTLTADRVRIDGAGVLNGSTTGGGRGSTIRVVADELSLAGEGTAIKAETSGTGGGGAGGDVELRVGTLEARGGAAIAADTKGDGAGGRVDVRATRSVLFSGIRTGVVTASAGNSGGAGGTVSLTTPRLMLRDQSGVVGGTLGSGDAGAISVDADVIEMSGESFLNNSTEAGGNAGDLTVRAGRVSLTGGSTISANTEGAGRGGQLSLRAGTLTLAGRSIMTAASSGSGAGGALSVRADAMRLTGGSILVASSLDTGAGGSLSVRAGALRVDRGAIISSSAVGAGPGGSIDLRAEHLRIRGTGDDGRVTGLFGGTAEGSTGASGNMRVRAGEVVLENGAFLSVSTGGSGTGGTLDLAARSVDVSGPETTIAALTTQTVDGGPGGRIGMEVGRLFVHDGGRVLAATTGSGAGGEIVIDAGRVRVRGKAGDRLDDPSTVIGAGTTGTGAGGRFTIRADRVLIERAGTIAAGTSGAGAGGRIELAAGQVRLDGGRIVASSQPDDPSVPATGDAGSVAVRAGEGLSLRGRSEILATATTANGGDVVIVSPRVTLRDSAISAKAGGTGGSIVVTADTLLYLFNSQINAEGRQAIGNISIDPIFTVLNKSQIVTDTSAPNGGDIGITTQRLLKTDDSVINARRGTATVTQLNPDLDVSGSLVPVNVGLFDRAMGLAELCPLRLESEVSSFLITSSGALPVQPGGLLPAVGPATRPVGR